MHKHLRREKKVFQIVDLSAIIEKKNAVKLSKEVGRSLLYEMMDNLKAW